MSLAALANSAALNLVQCQLAPNGVRDDRVLDAFLAVDRALYVPPALKSFAYIDDNVSDATQSVFLLRATTLAWMLQHLATVTTGGKIAVMNDATHYVSDLLTEMGYTPCAIEGEAQRAAQKWDAIILNGAVMDMDAISHTGALVIGIEQKPGSGVGEVVALHDGIRTSLGQASAPYIKDLLKREHFSL